MRLAQFALGAVFSLVAASTAAAAEYHGVVVGDGYIMIVDKNSIYPSSGYIRGWVVTIYAKPNEDQDPFLSTLDEFDCQQHRWRAISFTSRDEKGAVLQSIDNDDPSWTNVEPSTHGEDLEKAICTPSSMTDDPLPTDNLVDLRTAYVESLEEK